VAPGALTLLVRCRRRPQGVPFLVASALLFGGFGVATHTFSAFPGVAA
jgi:hypothetical protein